MSETITEKERVNVLYMRRRIEVNTDPQKRCYNGCHFSSELRWTDWESLGPVPPGKEDDQMKFWTELNDYAVSQRGPNAKAEFKFVKEAR